MVSEYEESIGGDGSPPRDWRGTEPWPQWRGKVVDLIAQALWPRYDRATGWQGAATTRMLDLTRADFTLLQALRPVHQQQTPIGTGTTPHAVLMELEDDGDVTDDNGVVLKDRSLDKTLRLYLTGLADPAAVDHLAKTFIRGLYFKSGSVDLQLKRSFQRPRAYQMAYLMGEDWFTHNHAKSAVSPALISGHCFQGALGGVAAHYNSQTLNLPAAATTALQRHTVDVGDRRVFAGVHYPSDNISSWITALLIAPLVCPDGSGGSWLWQSVATHSAVYKALSAAILADPSSPFTGSMRLLRHIGANPGITVDDAMAYANPGS